MSVLEFKDFKGFMASNVITSASDVRHVPANFYDLSSIESALKFRKSKLRIDTSNCSPCDEECSDHDLEVVEILRNYSAERSFKNLSALRLSEVLSECYARKRDVWLGESDIAIWSYGTSPDGFYLKWVKNMNQCTLLSLWLTEMALTVEESDEVTEVAVHMIFAVEFDVDRRWYRGEVINIINNEVVECFFMDYGRIEKCYIDQLRQLPVELVRIPPYAFKCKLMYINPVDTIEGSALLCFATELKNTRRIQCRLGGLMKECSGFNVELWNVESQSNLASVFQNSSEDDKDERGFVEPLLENLPLEEEIALLVHGIGELKFPSHIPVPSKGYDCYRIEEAVDPDEIYVWNQASPDEETVDWQQGVLNNFYSNPQWLDAYRIQTLRVFRNRPYAWFNRSRSCWERVTVVRTDMPVGQVFVQRIDFGNKLVVNIEDLKELSQRFCAWPPKVELAHLVHIRPKYKAQHWSFQTCRKFRALVNLGNVHFGTLFSREGISRSGEVQKKTWKSLGLLLVYVNEKLPYSLQGLLVCLRLAEGTGIGAGHPSLIFAEQGCPKYSKKEKLDSYSSLNDSEKILSKRTMLETLKYPYSVVGNTEDLMSLGKLPKPLGDLHKDFLPQYLRVCLGWVKLTQINSPSHFYVQMQYKNSEFDQMSQDISETLNHDPICFDSIKPGMFVAVFFVHEEYSEFSPTWNRAFIVSTNPVLRNAQVILIDYGIETLIKYWLIRKLPAVFRDVLPYCRRAHLRLADQVPTGSLKWSEDARCNFLKYIEAWSSGLPIYLAYQEVSSEGVVHLETFEQELTYCRKSKDWVACSHLPIKGDTSKYNLLNECKSDKILQHLFCSIPLLVYYEVLSENDSFYTYKPVWDILIENGFLMKSC